MFPPAVQISCGAEPIDRVGERLPVGPRAKAEIAFSADIALEEGLKRLIAWRNAHKAEVAARRKAVGLAA